MTQRTWTLEDHLCRSCGGRILRCATGNGMTPGGNPIRRCADCGASCTTMGPDEICWCGYAPRLNSVGAYRCLPFRVLDRMPELAAAFRACGFDPERGEVGFVLERDLRTAQAEPRKGEP